MRLARHFEMGGVRGERDLRLTHLHRKKSESLFSESSCMFSFVTFFYFGEISFSNPASERIFISLWVNGFWVLGK